MMHQLATESKRKAPLGLPSTRVKGAGSFPSARRHRMSVWVSGSTNNNCPDNLANGTRDLGLGMSEEPSSLILFMNLPWTEVWRLKSLR